MGMEELQRETESIGTLSAEVLEADVSEVNWSSVAALVRSDAHWQLKWTVIIHDVRRFQGETKGNVMGGGFRMRIHRYA